MSDSTLEVGLVFQALTKQSLILGVDYDYFFIALMTVLLIFISTSNLLSIFLLVPLHVIGMSLCAYDRHIFRMLSVRANIGVVPNINLWSVQCYQAY